MGAKKLDLGNSAVLILDIQEDFLEARGALGRLELERVPDAERKILLANCRKLTDQVRDDGRPVIHVQTAFRPDLTDCFFPPKWLGEVRKFPPILVEGSPGAAAPQEIAPKEGDFVLTKKGLNPYQFTYLDRLLPSLGIDTCILAGFCGVAGSITEAVRMGGFLGYDAVVASDAVYPLRSSHLKTLTNRAAIKEAAEIVAMMKAAGPRKEKAEEIRPALILVALNNDGNHPMGSKSRYGISQHGPGLTPEQRETFIRNNNRIIAAMAAKGFPVIHAQTAVRLDGVDDAHSHQAARNHEHEWSTKFPPGVGYMIEGTWGAEILEGVKLPEGYCRVFKKGNSAFGLTHLHRVLRNFGSNVCIVTGDSTTGCVSDTVREGVGLGYKVIVVSDATSRPNIPYHQVLANRADVMSTDEVLRWLEGLPSAGEKNVAARGQAMSA